ncbi:hypothetical protein SAMN06297229_1408 [Pseudidiomarina planktonica]|uniref:Amino acid ABC transporter substrate-binding protein, PAAT family n=1 Tax=Pseudidiomarina planktonica TaxID=1323738 RepID=A0A1Y6EUJ4_9GAMM|nr:hypothetical protein [Pseudidiomarina planktonica]RUO65216.1 hypothetical protein CWI77_01730 [Pseudidiomarina planktonica]SMQ65976.1 hypothetical protein SAMN06297229_1408 [Pseudidiomarina planktonica]
MAGWSRWWLLVLFSLVTSSGFANTTVVMNKAFAELTEERDYNYQLLKRALAITADDYTEVALTRYPLPMTQTRLIHELTSGKKVQVGVLASGYWQQPGVIAIPVPVRRGLLGWRLLVTHEQTLQRLPDLAENTEALSSLTTGFGADWVELPLMRDTFAHVETVEQTSDLYQQLLDGNFDVFSRSVIELWLELENLGSSADKLAVVPGVVLRYPFADFFYVPGDQPELAKRIELGLQRLYANGDYEALFMSFYGAVIARAELNNRRIIELKNIPLAPVNEIAEQWWYRP